jgi:Gpi18-like mannosyltransferase
MPFGRYTTIPKINKKLQYGTSKASPAIFFAIESKALKYSSRKLLGGERLDTISFDVYGDSRYWWVIAAATGIGWCLQVPPGTLLRIPTNLDQALKLSGRR